MPHRRRGTSRGQGLSDAKIAAARAGSSDPATVIAGGFKKGGTVKKTAIYKLHKGETVIPAKKKPRR